MNYSRQNFVDGQKLYASHLNHIEDGIGQLEDSLNHNMEIIDKEIALRMKTPSGGEAGQVLTKTELGFAWQTLTGSTIDDSTGDGQASLNLYDDAAASIGLLTSSGGCDTSYTGFKASDYILVDPNTEYCFQNSKTKSSQAVYVCYYDSSKTFISPRMTYNMVSSNHVALTTPDSAMYARFAWNLQDLENVMISVGSELKTYEEYGSSSGTQGTTDGASVSPTWGRIYAEVTDGKLSASVRYSNRADLCVVFGAHGGNNLPDFWKLLTVSNTQALPNMDLSGAVEILNISTDWHGPYIVKALNNIDGDAASTSHYTGGNHNYSNDSTSGYTATAVCDSLEYIIDGAQVETYAGYCSDIRIKWVNRVQAANTKKEDGTGRYVLRECHELRFDGMDWISSVDIEPLEDVKIQTYYGFQASGVSSIYPNYRFIGGENRQRYTNAENHVSGNANACGFEAYGDEHRVRCVLDQRYDIGDRRYYEGTEGCFAKSNKMYTYLIDNLNPALKGNIYSARARYTFSHA